MASANDVVYPTPFNLNPLSCASTVVGFISFAFTLLTLLRVTCGNIIGLWEAPDEIRYTFVTLKSALHEERKHCRVAWRIISRQLRNEKRAARENQHAREKTRHRSGSRKGQRRKKSGGRTPYSPTLVEAGVESRYLDPGQSDDSEDEKRQEKHVVRSLDVAANWKVLYGSARRLCKQSFELERPFLKPSVLERQERAERLRKQANAQEKRSYPSHIDTEEDPGLSLDEAEFSRAQSNHFYTDDYLRDYVSFDLSHRIVWLRIRSSVDDITSKLLQVQVRRSSAEITQVLRSVATVEAGLRDLRLIQDQNDHRGGDGGGSHRDSPGGGRRSNGERWQRVHIRRTVQDS